MKFRKKPVVIDAVHYIGGGNVEPRGGVPYWLWDALANGTAYYTNGADPLKLATMEGDMTVAPGDWIIRGVKGELYPCKPDIFAATYEPVGDPRVPPSLTTDDQKDDMSTIAKPLADWLRDSLRSGLLFGRAATALASLVTRLVRILVDNPKTDV